MGFLFDGLHKVSDAYRKGVPSHSCAHIRAVYALRAIVYDDRLAPNMDA